MTGQLSGLSIFYFVPSDVFHVLFCGFGNRDSSSRVAFNEFDTREGKPFVTFGDISATIKPKTTVPSPHALESLSEAFTQGKIVNAARELGVHGERVKSRLIDLVHVDDAGARKLSSRNVSLSAAAAIKISFTRNYRFSIAALVRHLYYSKDPRGTRSGWMDIKNCSSPSCVTRVRAAAFTLPLRAAR